jgi:undecaprenyl pyrophosphate phosphatase UppP
MQTYTHVIPGMDQSGVSATSALILGESEAEEASRLTHDLVDAVLGAIGGAT